MLLSLLLAAASPKLPAWKASPPPRAAEAAVMAPIDAMFAGLAARDSAAILAQVRPEGAATVAVENADGSRTIRHRTWAEFAGGIKPGPERFEERLTDHVVEVDGDIAMVWAPYVFLLNGKAHHCGVDHFDLVREADAWKILNITWSQRANCEGMLK